MNEIKVKQAKKLIKDIDKKVESWDERSQFKIQGVGNLSKGNLDMMKFYAEALIRTNGNNFDGFMSPRGEMEEVFKKYKMI